MSKTLKEQELHAIIMGKQAEALALMCKNRGLATNDFLMMHLSAWIESISAHQESEAVKRTNIWWSNRYNELSKGMQAKIDGLVNSIASGIGFADAVERAGREVQR